MASCVPFADDIARWNECQRVISIGVTYINEHGLERGSAAEFKARLAREATACGLTLVPSDTACGATDRQASSQRVADQLENFLHKSESQLRESERVPQSTEILESSFGLYKQLEGQHSKSGFTSLLGAFGALLRPLTPELVRECLQRVGTKELAAWQAKNFPRTLTSQRRQVLQEFATPTHPVTPPIPIT